MRIPVVGACGAVAALAALALLAGRPHDTAAGVGADAVGYRLLPGSAPGAITRPAPTPTPSPVPVTAGIVDAGIWATPAEFAPPE